MTANEDRLPERRPSRREVAAEDLENENAAREFLVPELLRIESSSQEQTSWLLAATIVFLTLVGEFLPQADSGTHAPTIRIIGASLTLWFAFQAMLIRRGHYASWQKYFSAFLQTSMVSAVILIDAHMRGPVYALSSMPPLFYALGTATSALTFSPRLSLATGALSALQLIALYGVHLRPMIVDRGLLDDPLAGWPITIMKAVVLLAVGGAAALMALKARRLLVRTAGRAITEQRLKDVESEMRTAAEIQRRLIPTATLDDEGFEFASCWRPARNVGGDYFDVLYRSDGRRLVVVADVSGKGYPAALTMSNMQAMVRTLAERSATVGEIACELNRRLTESSVFGRFVTMVCAEFDPAAATVRYVNCGHLPALLMRPGGPPERLETGGPPLGAVDDAVFLEGSARFEPGDSLVLFTDGLSEAKDPVGGLLGLEAIEAACARSAGSGPGAVRDELLSTADAFMKGKAPHDDLTLIAVRKRRLPVV